MKNEMEQGAGDWSVQHGIAGSNAIHTSDTQADALRIDLSINLLLSSSLLLLLSLDTLYTPIAVHDPRRTFLVQPIGLLSISPLQAPPYPKASASPFRRHGRESSTHTKTERNNGSTYRAIDIFPFLPTPTPSTPSL